MISWGEVPRRPPWRVRLARLVYRVQDWWEVRQGRRIRRRSSSTTARGPHGKA